jgi:hypothetical protein
VKGLKQKARALPWKQLVHNQQKVEEHYELYEETNCVIDRHILDSPTCPVEEGFVEYVESDEEYQDSDFDDVFFQSFISFLAIDFNIYFNL